MGGQSPAPLPGPKGKFGAMIAGALVLYRPDASKKELVVGKVLQNLRDSKACINPTYTLYKPCMNPLEKPKKKHKP